jgi:cytochrome oxidase assembly protein ShyY1
MAERRMDFSFARRPIWLLGHLIAVTAIATFFFFGSWQLSRLDERRATNATIQERTFGPPMALDTAVTLWSSSPIDVEYQRIAVGGTYRFADEFYVGPSSLDGASGFRVVTPLDANGEVVLVVRGWVPLDTLGPPLGPGEVFGPGVVDGYVLRDEASFRGVPRLGNDLAAGRAGRIDIAELSPVATTVPFYIVQQLPESGVRTLGDPSFDEGRHLSYAFQWFAFSAVTAVGYVVLMIRTSSQPRKRAKRPPARGAAV